MQKISKSKMIAAVAIATITLVLILSSVIKEDKEPTDILQFPANYNVLVNNLEKEGYETYVSTPQKKDADSTADIVLGFADHFLRVLSYCINENAQERAEELMDQITEKLFDFEDIASLEPFMYPVAIVNAFNEESDSYIIVIYFDNTQSAKELYEILKPYFDFVKKNSSNDYVFDDGVDIKIEDFVSGQIGNVVYLSTKNALNDIN